MSNSRTEASRASHSGLRRRNGRIGLVSLVVIAASLVAMPAAFASLTVKPARTWGTNGRINAVLPIGDRIFVGGSFTSVVDTSGVSYPARNLAVFSATTGRADLGFGVGTNNAVFSLATDGGSTLIVGGAFGTVDDGATVPRSGLAAVDIASGAVTSWAPSIAGGQVDKVTFAAATNSVYAGGNFTSVTGSGGTTSPHPFVAKIGAATGAVDTAFAAAPDDRVRSLNVAGDGSRRLFLGGDFLSVSGRTKTRALAAVDLVTGLVDTGFTAAATNQSNLAPVLDLDSDATRVYVAAAGSGGACTALSITGGAMAWTDHANGNMQSVRLSGSTLYCGGHFSGTGSFLGADRQKLAAVNTANGLLLPFNPQINSALGVWALGTQPGDPNLYLGGDFTSVSGVQQPHFAEFLDTTLQGPPQPPGSLVAQPTAGRVQLTWSLPSSDGGQTITSQSLYRGTTPGGENMANPLTRPSRTTTTYTDTAVTNGTTYYYFVAATNALGRSALSNEVSATPGAVTISPPGPPAAVAATNPPGTIELTWNPPASDGGAPVTSYRVYRGVAPDGEDATPHATGVTATHYSDASDLAAGTTYYYRLTALNSAGEGPVSAEVSALEMAGTPGTPVLSGSLSGSVAHLSWTVPADGGSPITKYVLLRDSVKLAPNLPPSTTTFDDTTVVPGHSYVYQVKAVNAQGAGKNSNKVTITS